MGLRGPIPRIQLAAHPTEQWGALNVYRGMAAFYRNGTAHRVRADDFDPEEAMRIVAWVDHLLGVIEERGRGVHEAEQTPHREGQPPLRRAAYGW